MPMQAESLEVLEKADVPSVQARAIVRAIEIEIGGAKDTLATKHDLLLHQQALEGKISDTRHELEGKISDVRHELVGKIANTRKELGSEIADARKELGSKIADVRKELGSKIADAREELGSEIADVREELNGKISGIREETSGLRGELRAEIQASASNVVRQMYMAVLGQMAVLLGFAYFFATHIR